MWCEYKNSLIRPKCFGLVGVYKIIHNFGIETFVFRCKKHKPGPISGYSEIELLSESEYLTHKVLES